MIQIVYAGNPDTTKITVSGVIEGQHEIHRIQYSGKILSGAEQLQQQQRAAFVWPLLGAGIIFLGIAPLVWRREKSIGILLLVGGLIETGLFIAGILSRSPEPPFGF